MGLFLALFCPVWLLTRRTKRSFELECLFVCGVCYLVWGYIWGVLRYAIPALIVLALLIAGRLGVYLDRSSRAVRGVAFAALVYGFCFAVLPTVFIELNFPQMRYFSGQIDLRAYLDEAVRFMPSIRYLESVWEPGDAALSVGNPAVYHAPDPARFHYIRSRRFGLDRLRRRLAGGRHDYNYVVGRVEDRAGLLELFEGARVVHSDGSFFVARTD